MNNRADVVGAVSRSAARRYGYPCDMANRTAMAEIVAELHKEPPMLLKSVGYLMHRTWSNGSDVWWDYIDKPGMTLAQIAPERRWPLFEDDQLCVCTPDYAAVCSPDHGSIARHGVENLAPEGRFMWQLEPYMTAAEYKHVSRWLGSRRQKGGADTGWC